MIQEILDFLPAACPWRDTLHWYPQIDSTNTQAKVLAAQGAPAGTVLLAGQQTGGRGRMGRSFHSPAGKGLYLSVILRPDCKAEQLMHLTCAVGVAVCDAVLHTAGFRPGIKWINDLVIGKRKLGGVLTELSVDPRTGYVDYAVIGIGLNCSHNQADFPAQLQDIATSVYLYTGKECSTALLAANMIAGLYELSRYLLTDRNRIMEAYRQDCITIGQRIVAVCGDEKRYGTAEAVLDDGSLLVCFDNGIRESVSSGEVSIRGMYGYI